MAGSVAGFVPCVCLTDICVLWCLTQVWQWCQLCCCYDTNAKWHLCAMLVLVRVESIDPSIWKIPDPACLRQYLCLAGGVCGQKPTESSNWFCFPSEVDPKQRQEPDIRWVCICFINRSFSQNTLSKDKVQLISLIITAFHFGILLPAHCACWLTGKPKCNRAIMKSLITRQRFIWCCSSSAMCKCISSSETSI